MASSRVSHPPLGLMSAEPLQPPCTSAMHSVMVISSCGFQVYFMSSNPNSSGLGVHVTPWQVRPHLAQAKKHTMGPSGQASRWSRLAKMHTRSCVMRDSSLVGSNRWCNAPGMHWQRSGMGGTPFRQRCTREVACCMLHHALEVSGTNRWCNIHRMRGVTRKVHIIQARLTFRPPL